MRDVAYCLQCLTLNLHVKDCQSVPHTHTISIDAVSILTGFIIILPPPPHTHTHLQMQTDSIAKIPQIILSISWKGVKFVNADTKVSQSAVIKIT